MENLLERWDDLRVLLAATQEGSFTGAARALELEQSTVSRRIASLEGELGGKLFQRTRAGLHPTELGDALMGPAKAVEDAIRTLVETARGHQQAVEGNVRLALTESMAIHVVVPWVLPQLSDAYPGLRLELLPNYRNADLIRREADLALRFERPTDRRLEAEPIAQLRTAVLGRRDYARGRALEQLDWVRLHLPGVPTPEDAWMGRHVHAAPRYQTSGYLTQVEIVRAGLGVAVLSQALTCLDERLVALDLDLPPTPSLELWLVGRKSDRAVRRIAAVRETLKTCLANLSDR